ncbi:MAG TPA: glycoside hydrolase family 88 protein, partial [Gammaproteobacteria bacterium]
KSPKSVITSILAAGFMLFLGGCGPNEDSSQANTEMRTSEDVAWAELSSPSEFVRHDEPVYFSFKSLGLADNDPRINSLSVPSKASQLVDVDADGEKDGLMMLLDFKPAETIRIEIKAEATGGAENAKKRTQAEISRKTGGEWQDRKYLGGAFENVNELVPPPQHTDHSEFIRYEGPGIESDKVGYRIYLDWRNGFDIFGKKTPEMVLQNVGQDGFESYHHMADWGMDILKVGDALGVGGYGYWNGEKVERVSNVDGWQAKVVENGDIYSALRIIYKGWQVADKQVDLTSDISMTAGSRLAHVRLEVSEELPHIAIGLVKHEGTKLLQGDVNVSGYAWTYVASYGKQSLSGENDNLGMALLFKRGSRDAQTEDAHNYVSVMELTGNNQLEYYFVAAWDGEPNGIKSEQEFVAYLEREAERLTMPPRTRLTTALGLASKTYPITAEQALAWSRKMADSELERSTLKYAYGGFDVMRKRPAFWEYTTGLQLQAYYDLAEATGKRGYAETAEQVIGSFVADDGAIRTYKEDKFNIDSINSGKMLLRLYEDEDTEKYRLAAEHLRRQLEKHPRTSEGAFWHKKIYPYQVWLDGVYMGMPFLAHYSVLFEEGASLEEAVNEFKVVHKHLRDPETGLYFHAWDEKKVQEWADPETGRSRFFWSRGLGWFAMALVDILDYIPEDKKELREPLIEMIRELAPAVVKVQDAGTGLWYQILDQPDRTGNYLESSGSSMFVYMLAKAVNQGYLPSSYKEAAIKGYEGIIREFINVHPDGTISITNACTVAGLGFGRNGSYRYYMSEPVVDNDPKALGPFIMAGVEISKLLEGN